MQRYVNGGDVGQEADIFAGLGIDDSDPPNIVHSWKARRKHTAAIDDSFRLRMFDFGTIIEPRELRGIQTTH